VIEAKPARHGEVISELDEVKALKVQLEQELEQHKADRTDAGAVILEAAGLQEKEEAALAKECGEMQTNIAAMGVAIDLIKKCMGRPRQRWPCASWSLRWTCLRWTGTS
jgi:hypothetical protein